MGVYGRTVCARPPTECSTPSFLEGWGWGMVASLRLRTSGRPERRYLGLRMISPQCCYLDTGVSTCSIMSPQESSSTLHFIALTMHV